MTKTRLDLWNKISFRSKLRLKAASDTPRLMVTDRCLKSCYYSSDMFVKSFATSLPIFLWVHVIFLFHFMNFRHGKHTHTHNYIVKFMTVMVISILFVQQTRQPGFRCTLTWSLFCFPFFVVVVVVIHLKSFRSEWMPVFVRTKSEHQPDKFS